MWLGPLNYCSASQPRPVTDNPKLEQAGTCTTIFIRDDLSNALRQLALLDLGAVEAFYRDLNVGASCGGFPRFGKRIYYAQSGQRSPVSELSPRPVDFLHASA